MKYAYPPLQRLRLTIPAPRPAAASSPTWLHPPRTADPQSPADDGHQSTQTLIRTSLRDGYTLVRLAGELDLITYDTVLATLLNLLEPAGSHLVVDLDDVTFIDARGVSPLVSAGCFAARNGGWVHLTHVNDRVRIVLELLRLTGTLPIYDTVEAAAAAAAGGGAGVPA